MIESGSMLIPEQEPYTHSVSLENLPEAPPGHTGWPWRFRASTATANASRLRLPRITIVTPSYNQAPYLEETIRSVLLQGYPNLEYIVLDGGSTDGSREILQRYASCLTFWRSEKDAGQSAAIHEGFTMATGDILGWLNSDDLLLPRCLQRVAACFHHHPQTECLVGGVVNIDAAGRVVRDRMGLPKLNLGGRETFRSLLIRGSPLFMQPASFWRREAYLAVGGVDADLAFAMDYGLYLGLASRKPFAHTGDLLACFRRHPESKTSRLQSVRHRECHTLRMAYGLGNYSATYRRAYKTYLSLTDRLRNLPARIALGLGLMRILPEGFAE